MTLKDINYKKLGLIIGFLAIAGVIGYFIYSLFFKSVSEEIPSGLIDQAGIMSGLPQSGTGTPIQVPDTEGQLPGAGSQTTNGIMNGETVDQEQDSILDMGIESDNVVMSSNGQMQYYNRLDGKFYKLGDDGQPITLSDKQFFGVENIIWSNTSDKAILELADGSKIRYNFNTKEQITLPKHWEDFDFSPQGDKIVAKSMGVDPNNRWLIISNDDGSGAQKIEELGENGDKVISSWSPNNQTIAMYLEGVDYNRKEIYFVGQNHENFKSMVVEGRGFQPQWSPQGDELLYSVYSADNDYKPTLWLVSAQGDSIGSNRRPIGLDTWADKCSFTSGSIYCAVPRNLERGAGLFPQTANNTPDRLFRIDSKTGLKQEINLGNSYYTMKNLIVSPDGQYLYFTDTSTNRLRKIKL